MIVQTHFVRKFFKDLVSSLQTITPNIPASPDGYFRPLKQSQAIAAPRSNQIRRDQRAKQQSRDASNPRILAATELYADAHD